MGDELESAWKDTMRAAGQLIYMMTKRKIYKHMVIEAADLLERAANTLKAALKSHA